MKCLIVAAGPGSGCGKRVRSSHWCRILGVPLIERVIERARSAGVDEFVVVSGYRGDDVRGELDAFSAREGVRITHVVNTDWDRANGVSVLAGQALSRRPVCADHVRPPGRSGNLPRPDGSSRASRTPSRWPWISISTIRSTTPRMSRGSSAPMGASRQIGKVIRDFNAIDTGVFLCSPVIFDALEASQARGDDSISGAMNVLARMGQGARLRHPGQALGRRR